MSAKIAPKFPENGYLPSSLDELLANRKAQQEDVDNAQCDARQQGQPSPCVQVLNISLFFDGTNNHGDSDDKANPRTSSNVRRLFNASIGTDDGRDFGYYSYYIQGVGTVFQEIGESEPSGAGLALAKGGENRILWGVTRLVDALRRSMSEQADKLVTADSLKLIEAMQYRYEQKRQRGGDEIQVTRRTTPEERKATMKDALQSVLVKRAQDYRPKVLKIRLFVYGFSRGAAEARAFLWRLRELMDTDAGTLCDIPLTVEFAGLFDTVASVGLTELAPGAQGHMGWADGTMKLPPGFVRQCAHMVSAHEQRLCFPLDSVATTQNGSYPNGVIGEWVYPGMHSDVGGGYPPGDQGKSRDGQIMLLSQLPLLHMYRLAFDLGAPLQVDKERLTKEDAKRLAMLHNKEPWRFMETSTSVLFNVDLELLNRFEAWRSSAKEGSNLNEILEYQAAQITAWRIARYAGGIKTKGGPSYRDTEFFKHCQDTPAWQDKAQKTAWEQAGEQRKKTGAQPQKTKLEPPKGDSQAAPVEYLPNVDKDYEPARDRTQVSEGAKDFTDDYMGWTTVSWNLTGGLATFFTGLSRPFSDDCSIELDMLVADGEALYTEVVANTQLMALYDEHVHDSRAWFMHYALNKREPHGTYLRYRTVFFTDEYSNKKLLCKSPRARTMQQEKTEALQSSTK